MTFVKTAAFFIKDLLTAKHEENRFVQRGVAFTEVIVCGTVTQMETLVDGEKPLEFFVYTVDDGTECISCVLCVEKVIEERFDVDKVKSQMNLYPEPSRSTTKLTVLCLETFEKKCDFRRLRVGDDVRLTGTMRQDQSLRYICVDHIQRVSIRDKVDNYEEFFHFYDFIA